MKIRWSACITALCLVFLVSGMPVDAFAREFEREEAFEGDPTGGVLGSVDVEQYGGSGDSSYPNVEAPVFIPISLLVIGPIVLPDFEKQLNINECKSSIVRYLKQVSVGHRQTAALGCSR